MRFHSGLTAVAASLAALPADALSLDVKSSDSIKAAAKSVAQVIIDWYPGNQTGNPIGLYGEPYYWWSSGSIWEAMVDYWYLTGDSTWNSLASQALLAQVGSNNDYLPANQTASEGNDDQSIWALAALTAAERNFSSTATGNLSWLALATNVFEEQVNRWDNVTNSTCDGGLRWQIFPFNAGYNYKNSLANGQFFQLAARLALLTNNQTYADWAETTYSWLTSVGFVDTNGAVYDGASTTSNCSAISKFQYSSNAGVILYGCAAMYNYTQGGSTWSKAINTILNETKSIFFKDGVMIEEACESIGTCNLDMVFYKGMLSRDLARTARAAPFTADTITPLLQSSAEAAASVGCTNSNGSCAFKWQNSTGAGNVQNLGSQYSALEVIQANLQPATALVSGVNGTTSGNNNGSSTTGQGGNSTGTGSGSGKSAGTSLTIGLFSVGTMGYTAVFLAAEFLVLGFF